MAMAICEELVYEKGSFDLVPSCSTHHGVFYPHIDSLGTKWKNRGTGWAQGVTSSKLTLVASVEGEEEKQYIWIDRFFKNRLGRLTQKRRAVIIAAMPASVEVERRVGRKGTVYYIVLESELEKWLNRVR